jgi:hypothetical protein
MQVDLTVGHEIRLAGLSVLEMRCAGRTIWWTPSVLFASGQQGAWYDPSDFSTLFQDDAGTMPVTAVGQAVGRILDKSGRGHHAAQSNASFKPTLQQDGSGRYYLAFDGLDDFLVTSAINFTSTSQMSVFVGYRKLSDSAFGAVVELSAVATSNNGAFLLAIPPAASNTNATFFSRGTTNVSASRSVGAAPVTAVITCQADVAGDTNLVRINGVAGAAATGDQGTGPYGNYPLYIGRRAGTSAPITGRLYSLIVRGAATTPSTLAMAEAWVNAKTGAF